jgi:1,2-diacylglycerol 3-alpha-glucosyltransferase
VKIGILTNTFPPNLNGVSVAVNSLYKNLQKNGDEVFVVTPKSELTNYPSNILTIAATKLPEGISSDLKLPYFYTQKLVDFFGDNKVQIIHSHDTMVGGIEAVAAAMKLKIPCIHTFHTLIESYNYFTFPGYKNFIRRYVNEVCNNYDHIISPSKKTYQYLLELGIKVPISNILNIPDLSDLSDLKNNHFKNNSKIGNTDLFYFVTFCRLAKEKNLDLSLEILAPLLKKYSNIRYKICGSGPYQKNLEFLAKKLNILDKIIFTGNYQRQELPNLTLDCQVFLFTSLTDNLPTNLLEAMYLGLPVVAVDDLSVDYILKNNQNGFKTSSQNLTKKCEELYKNPKLIQEFSQNAKLSAKAFSKQKILEQHLKLYNQVIELYEQKPDINLRKNLLQFLERIPKFKKLF